MIYQQFGDDMGLIAFQQFIDDFPIGTFIILHLYGISHGHFYCRMVCCSWACPYDWDNVNYCITSLVVGYCVETLKFTTLYKPNDFDWGSKHINGPLPFQLNVAKSGKTCRGRPQQPQKFGATGGGCPSHGMLDILKMPCEFEASK